MFHKQQILDKVQTLREERNMFQYCDAIGVSPQLIEYIKKIITMIQYHIFDFDAVCEHHTGSVEELEVVYQEMKQNIFALVLIVTQDTSSTTEYTDRLFSFCAMELDMRRVAQMKTVYKSPLDYSIEEFYLLKSCDVFLSRKLVGVLAGIPESYTRAVQVFDLLGEIVDDLMDVEEDQRQINANRFLISLVHYGEEKTLHEYRSFVMSTLERIDKESEGLTVRGLDLVGLTTHLHHYLHRDWSAIQKSTTNELLFGV